MFPAEEESRFRFPGKSIAGSPEIIMKEKTIHSKTAFTGKLLRLEVQEVELEDGTRSVREIVRHSGAAAVLAMLDEDRFLLVKQFRKAIEAYSTEIIAGTLDPGEDPETCARREVEEETGHRVARMERLGEVIPSPGYLDERITVFRAVVFPADTELSTDEDERVDPTEVTRAELIEMLKTGEITDAKTLAAWGLHETIQPMRLFGEADVSS